MSPVGTIHPLASGGVLIETGDEFPRWAQDAGAARRYLLNRDLMAAELDQEASDPGAPDTTGVDA